MLKAVLFDLDHTLIDWATAEPWETRQARRLRQVFDYVNTHLHPLDCSGPESLFRAYITAQHDAWTQSDQTLRAPDIRLVLTEALAACGVPTDRLDLDAVMDVYDWQAVPGARAFPDVLDVLPELRGSGLELGIITNASHPMIYRDRELQALELLDLFPTCRLSAVDVGVLKPHRAIFDRALTILGIQAAEAVFVGDSLEADIKGAQRAGMKGVWRATPGQADNPTASITPDGTITTLHDLLPLLDGWYPGWREEQTL